MCIHFQTKYLYLTLIIGKCVELCTTSASTIYYLTPSPRTKFYRKWTPIALHIMATLNKWYNKMSS